MKLSDAAQILGLSGALTPETVKRAYRAAAMTYSRTITRPGIVKLLRKGWRNA
jgi:hypothetical protein